MKRWTLRIVLCLVLGAVTTVGVVAGSWRYDRIVGRHVGTIDYPTLKWQRRTGTDVSAKLLGETASLRTLIEDDFADEDQLAILLPGYLSDWSFASWATSDGSWQARTGRASIAEVSSYRCGWPARAANCRTVNYVTLTWGPESPYGHYSSETLSGLYWELMQYSHESSEIPIDIRCEYVPNGIVLPGFVIDTFFYAGIWFGVFFGFTSAKRFIRARRGRCPRCAYDLRGQLDAGCPECGWNRQQSDARAA